MRKTIFGYLIIAFSSGNCLTEEFKSLDNFDPCVVVEYDADKMLLIPGYNPVICYTFSLNGCFTFSRTF